MVANNVNDIEIDDKSFEKTFSSLSENIDQLPGDTYRPIKKFKKK